MTFNHDLILQYKNDKHEIHEALERVFASGQYILGTEVAAFENEFSEYLGVNHSVGVASGTDGLILALMALGISYGDEVITSPYTAMPTISAIHAVGAHPVFVDVDVETFLIDIERIPAAMTSKTKAIIPVHIFGNMVDCRKIRDCIGASVPIIEDACQSHGSTFDGVKAGAFGDIGVFSFYPTKNLGSFGDGGMAVTDNETINDTLRILRNHGMTDGVHASMPGINSRLDEIQAAILRIRLKGLEKNNEKRAAVVASYRDSLRHDFFDFQVIGSNIRSNYHVFASRFKGDRDHFKNYLAAHKIPSRVYYQVPIHFQQAYAYLGIQRGELPSTERLCNEVISLPVFPEMNNGTLDRIIDTINGYNG